MELLRKFAGGILGLLLPFAIACQVALAADLTGLPLGNVIEARSNAATTLFLWDATPYVTSLVHDRNVGNAGLHALEAAAVRSLASHARSSRAKAVTLRVLYQKTGAVSPVYGNPTFAGVEVVLSIHADRKTLQKNAVAWETALAQGTVPKGLLLQVLGKLPPQSP
ncbi:MAG TPA: hypothetical protein VFO29_09625 [Candidatus Rubrimentiphilum sp.]|nr:hypothetical protein [Candidatus Rubrimentiphilum sp.]